eukprot:SAG31_NODE_1578_length_7835_cov_6.998449_4_plen_581_part_00
MISLPFGFDFLLSINPLLGPLVLTLVVGCWTVAHLRHRLDALETAVRTGQLEYVTTTEQKADAPKPGSRNTLYGRTAAEVTAGVLPVAFSYPPGDCRRFGFDPTGQQDSTNAINTALQVPGEVFLCEGVASISAPIKLRSNSVLVGVSSGPYDEHEPEIRGSQIRPSAGFQGAAVILVDPATEGHGAYINGVGLRSFCVNMAAVSQSGLVGIQVLSAADPGVFLDLKVVNQDSGHFVYVGQSTNKGALQSEGVVFDNLLCLSHSIDPPNADAGVIVEAANEIHFKNGKVDRRSNGNHYPGSAAMLVRPSPTTGVTVNDFTSSQMSYCGFETGKKVISSPTAGQGPRWIRANYCMYEGPRYGFAVFGAPSRPAQFCSAVGNRKQTAFGDQPAVIYIGDYCCNGTFEQDEEPGYHPRGAGPAYTVFASPKSQANTILASPHSGVRDEGICNLVQGRDPNGSFSVPSLSTRTIATPPIQKPTTLENGWRQYSATNRSAVGFWLDPMNCLHLQGHVTGGSLHVPVFTLPKGLAPAKDKTFAVAGASTKTGATCTVRISAQGGVVVDAGDAGWVSFDSIWYRVGD